MAVFDKDVTYEHIMSSDEEKVYYSEQNFTGLTEDNSHVPTKTLKVLSLIKKNFHYLYYISQRELTFGWHTFLWEVLKSLVMATILCLVGYNVYSGTSVSHEDGYPADFWMASFGIYTALVYATLTVVVVRTSQITWMYILLYVLGCSLIPFFLLSYLYDTHLLTTPNLKEFVMLNLSATSHFYLFFLLYTMIAFIIEILFIFFRLLHKPTLADYFNWLIKNGKADNPDYFKHSILENFIKLQDPIQRKADPDMSDINSEAASFKNETNKEKVEFMEEKHIIGQIESSRAFLSVEHGQEMSTLPGSSLGTENAKPSKRSLQSQLPSLRLASKPHDQNGSLFTIEDSPAEFLEDDNLNQMCKKASEDKREISEYEIDSQVIMPPVDESLEANISVIKKDQLSINEHKTK